MKKYFWVLMLALALALTLTACGGGNRNGNADPGTDPGVAEDEPDIAEGEWYFIEGELYRFADLGSFILSFKEYEATYSDPYINGSLKFKHLGDDKVGRHFAVKVDTPDWKQEVELWFSETSELVQGGGRDEGGKFLTTNDPDELAGFEEDFFAHFISAFVMGPGGTDGENGDKFEDLFTDPEVFSRAQAEHGYVINDVSAQKRDFGTGKVTVIHYEYSVPDAFDCIYEFSKIGDKYMLVYGKETFGGDFTYERNVTRAIPLK